MKYPAVVRNKIIIVLFIMKTIFEYIFIILTKGRRKKTIFFNGPATKKGWGGTGLTTKKKYRFLKL